MITDKAMARPPIWTVPYQRNPFFTGREDVLSRLEGSLYADNPVCLVQPQGMRGLGGIGKTQTIVEYAYRHQGNYRAVLWIRADSYRSLVSDFVNIASLLKLSERNKNDQRLIVASVMRWLRTHAHWLLIFDGVEDFAVASEFIPAAGSGHILLTTRTQAMGGIAQPIEIEKMPAEVGALLLLRRSGLISLAASLDDALKEARALSTRITELLDGLPLALNQAGAYISETHSTLSAYLDLYYARRVDLLRERGSFDESYPESVATTWSLSFEKVSQANPAAAELLHLFAFLYPEGIPEEIITESSPHLGDVLEPASADALLLESAYGELLRYSLVDRNPDAETFFIHRLVQAVFKDRMDKDTQLLWAIRTIQAVNDVFPGVDFPQWSLCQRYILHAQECAALIGEWNLLFANAARLLNQTGAYLRTRAQYAEAEPLYLKALAIWEQTLGPDHKNTAACLNNLALLYEKQAKYELAEPLYLKALAIWEKVLDPLDPTIAICLNNIAELYRLQGKYKEAEPFFQRSLVIREQVWGRQHPNTATIYQNLADLYTDQGKYRQAKTLYLQALAIREQAAGPEHPDTATTLNSLALLSTQEGKYQVAEAFLQRSLLIQEKVFGPDHADTLTCLNNLALVYANQGRYEQAELLHQRILSIRERQMGANHLVTADSLNNLASLYSTQGKYHQAEEYYRRALTIYEQTLGHLHYKTASTLNNLAELYRIQERFAEAEPLYMQATAICEQVLGPDHLYTATTRSNIALLFQEQGFYEKAVMLHQKVLAMREQKFGADHPSTILSLHNIASLYRVQGKYEQAEALYQRVLEQRRHILDPDHPDIITTSHNLALLYTDWERYEQAEVLYKQALLFWTQKFGINHPYTGTILANYTNLLHKLGRDSEAIALLAQYPQAAIPTLHLYVKKQSE